MEVLTSSLVAVCAIIFGATFAVVQVMLHNQRIRDEIIGTVTLSIGKLILSSPKFAEFITSGRNWMSGSQKTAAIEAKLIRNDELLSIPFTLNGTEYTYLVPHSRQAARRGTKMVYVDHAGTEHDLKHYPGIALKVTSQTLGCQDIREADEEM